MRGEFSYRQAHTAPTERTEKGQEMTRKDYELIAEAVRLTRGKGEFQGTASDEATLSQLARSLSQLLKYENVRFNEEIFLTACGVN